MEKLKIVLEAIGALWVVCSFLANVMPAGSAAQRFFSRVALSLRGLQSTRETGDKPPPSKRPPIVPPAPLLALALALALAIGCSPGRSPPEVARDTIAEIARAVDAADHACAVLVASHALSDVRAEAIASKCVGGYRIARNALIAAQGAVASWRAAVAGELACSGAHALEGLASIVAALLESGVPLPPEIERGIDSARLLAGLARGVVCRG